MYPFVAVDESAANNKDAGMAGYMRTTHRQKRSVIALLGNVHSGRRPCGVALLP
jgi:hypothetical protein